MRQERRIPWHLSRGALSVGQLIQEASLAVAKTVAVAVAYRRALHASRGLRRLGS